MKAIQREWVERHSQAFSAALQKGALVVPKSKRRDKAGKEWIQVQYVIEVEEDSQ